jgi:6-pyruvoyl-tetrahydropterin synthase
MYTLTIADYLKCAHSLRGKIFGPAQQLHVSTFDVEVTFTVPEVDKNGIIVDFAAAQQALAGGLAPLRFQNLDDVREVKGINTTTENLCKYLHDCMGKTLGGKFRGNLRVTLHEGRVASASYEASLGKGRKRKAG